MKFKLSVIISIVCVFSLAAKKEIKRPDSYAFTRATEAINQSNPEEALEWFNKEIADHPDNGYAYLFISIIRANNEEYGRALTAINQALKKLPKKDAEYKALAYDTRAAIHLVLEDTLAALKDYEAAIKIEPDNSVHYERRAEVYFEQDKYDLADADYNQMVKIDPGDVTGYMGLGRNEKMRGNYASAIEKFSQAIRLEPEFSSGYAFRAECHINQKNYPEAIEDLIEALDIDSNMKAFYMMLWELPEEAVPLMKSKLKIQMNKQPAVTLWPYLIGLLEYNADNYPMAIDYFNQGNKIDASSIFLKKIAQSYIYLGKFNHALDYANQALAMDPDDYNIAELKADIFARLGKFDECIEERNKVIAQCPDESMAYFNRANDLMNARRFDDAIEDFNTAILINPELSDFPFLLMRRGDAYRFTGKADLANIDYNNLIIAEQDSLTSNSWTPFAYSGLGNSEKAIETMQLILDKSTDDNKKGDLYNMACIYARAGRFEDAVRTLKTAVDNGYDDVWHMKLDYDLDGIRELPAYIDIVNSLEEKYRSEDAPGDSVAESAYEVVEIPFSKEGGVTKVQCTINGLPLHFVFDTGAADVTISMVEANFMLKNDYIKPSDVIGSARYVNANGDVSEGTVINLHNVNFGGLQLDNVRASVVRNQKAPLLLGQSVLGRLGKIEIDNAASKLKITHPIK